MPPPDSTSSCSISAPSEERNSFRSRCARTDAWATLTSGLRIASSALRQSATLSPSGTANGSISAGGRKVPERVSSGASPRAPLPPAAAAKAQARSAASRAPISSRRRSHANPQEPPTSTRTPIPSDSASVSVITRPFRVPTDCDRRRIARASA